jgi:hypothetical protein
MLEAQLAQDLGYRLIDPLTSLGAELFLGVDRTGNARVGQLDDDLGIGIVR